MKYRVAFYLKDRPPIEVLTIPKGRKGTFGPLPGQVSLSLVNAQWDGMEGIEKFIKKFAVSFIKDSDREITVKERIEMRLAIELGIMNGYIEDVLLPQPPDYPALETVPTDKRLATFIKTSGNIYSIENFFRQVVIMPYARPESSIFTLTGDKLDKKLKKHDEAWENLGFDFEDDKPRKELSNFYVFAWRYASDNILSIAWLELFLMAEAGMKVKACRKCGNYYVPWPPNALHCPKCKKEYHSQKLHNEYVRKNMTEKEMEIDRARKRIYMQEYRARKKIEREEAERLKKERGE